MSNIRVGGDQKPTLFQTIKAVFVGEEAKQSGVQDVQGQSYLKGGSPPEGKKLSERNVVELGLNQALTTVVEHGVIREAKDRTTLDALEKRYSTDQSLDPENKNALLKAIIARRKELAH